MRCRVVQLVSCLVVSLAAETSFYQFEADDLQSGLPVPMQYYKGKVVLVINVASACGFTEAKYSQLNELHKRYASQGLAILAFPCNQFGAQEPGSDEQIFEFATKTKAAKFDLFRKVEVNGPGAHELFKFLRGEDASCADEHSNCAVWAQAGECGKNAEYMESACKLSCKLCEAVGAGPNIGWNFVSFVLSRSGDVHTRWDTGVDLTSKSSTAVIENLLAAKDEV